MLPCLSIRALNTIFENFFPWLNKKKITSRKKIIQKENIERKKKLDEKKNETHLN